jgi:hypothetical protein
MSRKGGERGSDRPLEVITEEESFEREMKVSSEIVALGTEEIRSDMEAIDSERSIEVTSDNAREE